MTLVERLRKWEGFGLHHAMPDIRVEAADRIEALEALEAEVAALRADAERYRWLRDKAPGEIVFDHTASRYEGGHHFLLRVPFDGEPVYNDGHSAMKLDAAIDAAIQQHAAGRGEG